MIQIGKVLYINSDGSYIHCDNGVLKIKQEHDSLKVPESLIEQVVVFGDTSFSSYIIKFCSEHGIALSFVSKYGNYYGRTIGKNIGNVSLRKKQYEMFSNNEQRLEICRHILLGKALNQLSALNYYKHNSVGQRNEEQCLIINNFEEQLSKLILVESVKALRGLEGKLSQIYFRGLNQAVKTTDIEMAFSVRSHHPPQNNFNALLSFLYTMLNLNCIAAIETFGLDSFLGFLHEERPGRESLANDLIEEFRSPFVDRLVVSIVNNRIVTGHDFENKKPYGIRLKDESRKKVLQIWERERDEKMFMPFYQKEIPRKIIVYLQAQLFSQMIRGDIEAYPPFHWEWK